MADSEPSAFPVPEDKPIPTPIRNLHLKAQSTLERNPDLAIEMLLRCVGQCPWFDNARRDLHRAAIARYIEKHNGKVPNNPLAGALALIPKMKISGLVKKGQIEEALQECEVLLKDDPLNINLVKLFAETAMTAKRPTAGLMAMEAVRDRLPPKDVNSWLTLGKLYNESKDYKKARDCFERVHRIKPTDGEVAKLLKDAEAQATLNSGWEQAHEKGDYRVGLADKEQAAKLEAANKSVKTEADAATLIRETLEKIQREPKNVNYYLALVGLYLQQKQYAEALAAIDNARAVMGQDPELDNRYASVKQEMLKAEIARLQEAGDHEQAAAKDAELKQYVFDDIAERVQRYPNDQHLRFLLGEQYYTYGYNDEAIQQFQISQRSPKDRVQSLYLMAQCFRNKSMNDMAVEQLKTALELLPSMDQQKMDVYYLLGELCEADGALDEASKYFKEIYRADVTYKDINDRIQRIYAAQKASAQTKA